MAWTSGVCESVSERVLQKRNIQMQGPIHTYESRDPPNDNDLLFPTKTSKDPTLDKGRLTLLPLLPSASVKLPCLINPIVFRNNRPEMDACSSFP